MWTIYRHIHVESGRCYVGQTQKTMLFRWNRHVYDALKRNRGTTYFANAIRRYGKDAFAHEILEVCETLKDADLSEIKWIEHFDSRNPEKGFNIKRGGSQTPHSIDNEYRKDPVFRAKVSSSVKKLWQDPVYRSKVLSATQTAIKTDEVRQKLSEGTKKAWKDPETRKKFELAAKERSLDPIIRSESRSRWDDPDFRERCSIGTRAHNEAERMKTHCKYGHEYTEKSTAIGKDGGRECKICNYARKKAAKTHCPKGHAYSTENTRVDARGRRICLICLASSKIIAPCGKCGRLKTMKIGGRMRCKPCTTNRINAWKKAQVSSTPGIV